MNKIPDSVDAVLTLHSAEQPLLINEGDLYDGLPFLLFPVEILLELLRIEV